MTYADSLTFLQIWGGCTVLLWVVALLSCGWKRSPQYEVMSLLMLSLVWPVTGIMAFGWCVYKLGELGCSWFTHSQGNNS